MKNNDFETRMNTLLDEREQLLADERLRALSREDTQSRVLLDSYRAMLEGIDSMENPPAPDDMAQRVLSELTRPMVVRSSPLRRVIALAAVAAALMAAVAFWQFNSHDQVEMARTSTDDKAARPLVNQSDRNAESATAGTADAIQALKSSAEASEKDPPLGTMVRNSSEAYAQLVRDAQESMADLALLFPGAGGAPLGSSTPKESPTKIEPSAESSGSPRAAGWMNQMTDGLRPFTSATSGAFNVLLRSLPNEVNDTDS